MRRATETRRHREEFGNFWLCVSVTLRPVEVKST